MHSQALFENTVAASALYNELVMAEVCQALGLASEPRTVSAGRRPVMEIAGIPHELIAWAATRSARIAACRTELEIEYTTAIGDDGTLRFAPRVDERARTKLNQIAAYTTRPAKPPALPLARLRRQWRAGAVRHVGAAVVDSLLQRARAAGAAIRARTAAVVDIALAAVAVAAIVFVMNPGGHFHRRHLLAEARRHLALTLRGQRREPGLDEEIVDTALAAHCTDVTQATTSRGARPEYRLYTTGWTLADLTPTRPAGPDRRPVAAPAAPHLPLQPEEWAIPRVPLRHDRATIAAAVVQTQARIARRTVRRAAHRPPARPEQLALFDPGPGGPPAGTARRRGVDLEALRTGLDALHPTADELRRMTEAFTATGTAARRRTHQHPRRPADDTPRTHRQERRRPPELGPDHSGGVHR
ncbi:relaxase domain-containing protein [Streptomyces fenghuangensis]